LHKNVIFFKIKPTLVNIPEKHETDNLEEIQPWAGLTLAQAYRNIHTRPGQARIKVTSAQNKKKYIFIENARKIC
jgi:hypothetical protein